jgi:hypothetical protein
VAETRRKAYGTIQSHKSVSEKEWREKRRYPWLVLEEDQKTLKELSFGDKPTVCSRAAWKKLTVCRFLWVRGRFVIIILF